MVELICQWLSPLLFLPGSRKCKANGRGRDEEEEEEEKEITLLLLVSLRFCADF